MRRTPTRGEIAAAKLIIKRHKQGTGNVPVTPMIEYLASSTPSGPTTKRAPNKGEIAAAKLIMKRDREGKGNVAITPMIQCLAACE